MNVKILLALLFVSLAALPASAASLETAVFGMG